LGAGSVTWIKQDDKLYRNPKARESSDAAFKVWVLSWSYCGDMTAPTGFMTTAEAEGFVRSLRKPVRVVEELIERHMWDAVDGGYVVHEFEQGLPNTSTERVRAFRTRKRAEAVSGNRGETLPHARAVPEPDPVPVPVPVPEPLQLATLADLPAEAATVVFEAWRKATGRTKTSLDAKRRKVVKARMAEGWKVVELILVVTDGWKNDPWNERPLHNEFERLLKDSSAVEKFLGYAQNGAPAITVKKSSLELSIEGDLERARLGQEDR
jgi:hypothetical protein